jgi:hypothetical protein
MRHAELQIIVEPFQHAGHGVLGRKDLDAEERRLGEKLLIRLGACQYTNVRYTKTRG